MIEKLINTIDKQPLSAFLLLLAVRLGFVLTTDLDLIGDESYYWAWSQQPDWCYYSKPPMVAWLIGLSTWLLGDVTAAVRVPAVVLGAVFVGYLHATTAAFYGRRAAAFAVLLWLAMPISVMANFVMTIDPPLYCFWIMTLYYLRRALFDGQAMAWLWAGCASAAALLSKQVALLLPLMVLIYLLMDSARSPLIKQAFGLYLAPILLAAVPIVWWNAQHDWVMFGHSRGHFGSHQAVSGLMQLRLALDFMFYQLLLVSPLLAGLVVVLAVGGARRVRQLSPEQQLLWLLGPVLLLAVLALSLLQKVQGNWSMPFYISAVILLAGYWQAGRWKKWLNAAVGVGAVMVAVAYSLPLLVQLLNLQNTPLDPTPRFKNWQTLAASVQAERVMALSSLDNTFMVTTEHRYLASELAFYLPDHPPMFRYEPTGQIQSQYEVWPGPVDFIGRDGFVISEQAPTALPPALREAFERLRLVAVVANPSKPRSPLYLYLGEQLRAWPALTPATASAAQ